MQNTNSNFSEETNTIPLINNKAFEFDSSALNFCRRNHRIRDLQMKLNYSNELWHVELQIILINGQIYRLMNWKYYYDSTPGDKWVLKNVRWVGWRCVLRKYENELQKYFFRLLAFRFMYTISIRHLT